MGAMRRRVFQAVAAALVMGCGGAERWEEPPAESHSDGEVSSAGANLNGANLNGANLNGANLNGANLNGANLNGRELGQMLMSVDLSHAWPGRGGGWMLDAVWLEGSVFHGLQGRRELSGHDFTGAFFTGHLGSGRTVVLRVDAVSPGSGVDADVWSYRVSYFDTRAGRWHPICRDARGSPVGAIPVEGRWDYRQGVPGGGTKIEDPGVFTFACEGAAIAKCVRYGYKPWGTTAGGERLAAHHQACTRLIRADFCGDGTSHTVDGQWVNLYDAAGVQDDTERWGAEAEWDERGARCIAARTRAHRPVSCPGERLPRGCGSQRAFRRGALLISEVPPTWGRGDSRFNSP